MTDEKLVCALRSIDHMSVDDCFLQSHFYGKAADRIEQLLKDNHRWKMECEEFWRKREDAAEDKLAKAYDIIARIIAIAPDGDEYDDEWHITYDAAKELLNKMEAGE